MNALRTWGAWLAVCAESGGSMNGFRGAGGVWYYVDAVPRQLQNGAIVGRVHVQRKGESMTDIGAFKIGADGMVLQVPDEVAALLPARAPDPEPPAAAREDLEQPEREEIAS